MGKKIPDTLVSFHNVQKTYDGETLIVKDLSLDIKKGEFLTLLGPSGSGKTTSLMMLAGFEVPTSGRIELGGVNITNVPPHKRNIGMVFQNYALFPHMTVAENLAFPLKIRKLAKFEVDERVKKALSMVQLDKFKNRYPGQMSGGQQQRVALARALVFEPQLVLMDEPLGALDKQLREHMQMEIKHLHDKLGITVVYVTHDQSEALTMSDRVAVFHHGEIQQIDAPNVIYEHPRNEFVANFIGENNNLKGKVIDNTGEACKVKLQDGTVIKTLNVSAGPVGSDTAVCVRPERIYVNPSSSECENIINAKIQEFIYLGDHVRACVEACGTTGFNVKLPISQFDRKLQPGSIVQLGWKMEHSKALDFTAS